MSDKPRAKRKTKTEKRYNMRFSSSGDYEAECPSCRKYVPISAWWTHKCDKPIVELKDV
jgi:hypothetical protein